MVGTEAGKTGLQRPEILSGAQRGPGPPPQHLHRQTPSQQHEDTVCSLGTQAAYLCAQVT